jgi:hypothetical protein
MMPKNIKHRGLKVAFAVAALFAAHATSAAELNLTAGDKITLDWGAGTFGHGSGGGEFMASGVAGSVLNGAGDSFLTFCLEYNSHISLNTPYYVDISTEAKPGGGVAATYLKDVAGTPGVSDPLSHATAWLYTQFRTNQLHNVVSSFNYNNNADANSLQAAIWVLENEQPTSFLGETSGNNQSTASKLFNAATATNWTDNGNVRVLDLWGSRSGELGHYTFSGDHQDQLYMIPVPEPETYAMMLAGLGLMGFVARRRRGRDLA